MMEIPAAIVGSGAFGSPAAAVLDVNGQPEWKYDAGTGGSWRVGILDRRESRVVVASSAVRRSLLYLDLESGKLLGTGTERRMNS